MSSSHAPSASSIELVSESFKHKDQVQQVAIHPDGHWAVTASLDSTVALWDLTAKDLTASPIVLRGHDPEVTDALRAIEISRDGHWLLTAGLKTVRLWDLTTTDPAKSGRLMRNEGTSSIAISHGSHWIYAGSFKSETAYRWDLTATDPSKSATVFRGHKMPISGVAISPNNRWLDSTGEREALTGSSRLWRAPWLVPLPTCSPRKIPPENPEVVLLTSRTKCVLKILDRSKKTQAESCLILDCLFPSAHICVGHLLSLCFPHYFVRSW